MHLKSIISTTLFIGIIFALITLLSIFTRANTIKVTAIFEDLEVYTKNPDVYFKGFRIGRTTKIYLSDDGSTTSIEMRLRLRNIKLPDNVIAKFKTGKKKDYIEISYPEHPSDTILHDDDVILGHKYFDITSYINNQADSGGLDEIKGNLNNTVKAAGGTFDALTELLNTGNEILKDLRPSLKESGENLAKSSKHIESLTNKLNKSTDSKKFANSTSNLEQATKNIEISTQNLANLTGRANSEMLTNLNTSTTNLNKTTANLVTATEQLKCILKQTDEIISGIKYTLSQKFSGMKIMFGNTIN